MTSSDPNDLVPAATVETDFEARTKAAVLEDAGVRAFVFDSERGWFGAQSNQVTGGGIPVMVRREDLERAKSILEARIEDSVDIDWSSVDVGKPDESVRSTMSGGSVWALFATIAGVIVSVLVAIYLTSW